MKTTILFYLFMLSGSFLGIAQTTYVPDNNFEQALIDLGYDNVLDDYVLTSNISSVQTLDVSGKNIADLTGIEDFTALISLNCKQNTLTSLNVTQNTLLKELIFSAKF